MPLPCLLHCTALQSKRLLIFFAKLWVTSIWEDPRSVCLKARLWLVLNTSLWLVNIGHVTWLLASDWSMLVSCLGCECLVCIDYYLFCDNTMSTNRLQIANFICMFRWDYISIQSCGSFWRNSQFVQAKISSKYISKKTKHVLSIIETIYK